MKWWKKKEESCLDDVWVRGKKALEDVKRRNKQILRKIKIKLFSSAFFSFFSSELCKESWKLKVEHCIRSSYTNFDNELTTTLQNSNFHKMVELFSTSSCFFFSTLIKNSMNVTQNSFPATWQRHKQCSTPLIHRPIS